MITQNTQLTVQELESRWNERVRTQTFSAHVLGLGTIRVLGKSGDARASFPRIVSLAALPEISSEEQWAIHQAETVISEAQAHDRHVFALPADTSTGASPVPVHAFDPHDTELVIVSRVVGG